MIRRYALLGIIFLTLLGMLGPLSLRAAAQATFSSSQAVVAPLQPVSIGVAIPGYTGAATLLVFDSLHRPSGAWELTVTNGSGSVIVTPRGALGAHWAALFANGVQVAAGTIFRLDAETSVQTGVAAYDTLYGQVRSFMQQSRLGYELDGQYVEGYRSPDSPLLWLRDHYYMGRSFRYFDSNVRTIIDAFRRAQQPDGSFPDFLARPAFGVPAQRTPVEADVEYLYVLAVYDVWQLTGDDAWMHAQLPAMQRAISYTLSSPLRWEPTLGLVKRPFTIDTWDFEYGPLTTDPTTGQPAPRHWIDDQTKWGIFHGDNTGLALALRKMSEMESNVGLWVSAWERRDLADKIMTRLNALSWNGRFYTHHVKLIPYAVPGVDEANQLSLSNALALNRGVLTVAQGRAIVKAYNDRISRPDNVSFAEWWSIDPPFPVGAFNLNGKLGERPGEYVNGGIMPLVGGELARGAFRFGYEDYGFDILRRYAELIRRSGATYLWYYPTGGISVTPNTLATDGWGSSAMLAGLLEGAAGVEDRGIRYNSVTISPRWPAAPEPIRNASVVTRYAASDGYVAYRWSATPSVDGIPARIDLDATGSGDQCTIRLLLPNKTKPLQVFLNGQPYPLTVEEIGLSRYVIIDARGSIVQVQVRFEADGELRTEH